MMNYPGITDTGLLTLYEAIREAIVLDRDAMNRGEPPPCRTSETRDWRDHAKGIEDELIRRDIAFIPVRFLDR